MNTKSKVQKFAPVSVHELYPSSSRSYLLLDGQWSFSLDSQNNGLNRALHQQADGYNDTIAVPGCLEAQGKGMTYVEPEQPGWWGTSDKPYLGVSWYFTVFTPPQKDESQMAQLNFGGVATECTVYLNGQEIGTNEYAIIPFGFDVSDLLRYGEENTLAVRVENNHKYERAPINHNGLGSTALEMMWSGIYRSVELVYQNRCHIQDMNLRWDGQKVQCLAQITDNLPAGSILQLEAFTLDGIPAGTALCSASANPVLKMENPHLWSDADPYLYRFTLTLLNSQGEILDLLNERFGLRTLAMENGQPVINGIPIYLRGDMVHFHWPVTISAPVDRDDIRQKLSVYKKYGMNFLRHHTHFPSQEYLDVCDEIGLLCHNELGICGGLWGIDEEHCDTLWSLALLRDRNHSSVIVWCLGNEKQFSSSKIRYFTKMTMEIDPTRFLLTDSPGWIMQPDGSMVRWPIMHEFRMTGASYIDLNLMNQYEGSTLRPWRMQFTQTRLSQAGLLSYASRFTRSTQLLQRTCRKILLEQVRENNVDVEELFNLHGIDYTGFVLCTFRDTGSFLWGTVDDFYGEKATTPEFFRNYVNDTVLLLGLKWSHRVYLATESRPWLPVVISCSHFGKTPVENGLLRCRVIDKDGNQLFSCSKSGIQVDCGVKKNIEAQVYIYDNVPNVYQKLTIEADLTWENGSSHNCWDVWLAPAPKLSEEIQPQIAVNVSSPWLYTQIKMTYPSADSLPMENCILLVTDRLDENTVQVLERGGRVLLLGQNHFPTQLTEFGSARSEFARGTIIMDHPMMDNIPNDGWCDIPFAGLISENRVLEGNRDSSGCTYILDERWPKELEPIIMGIPSYKDNAPKRLAHLFEIGVGSGRLIASTFKFGSPHAQSAFDLFFLDELLTYMLSDRFKPKAHITVQQLLNNQIDKPSHLQLALRDVNVFRSERRG